MSTHGGDDLPRPVYPGQEQPQYPPSPPTQPPTQPGWQGAPPPPPPSGDWPQPPYQQPGGPPPPGGGKKLPPWVWAVAALGVIAVVVIVVLLVTRGGDVIVEPTTTTTDRPTTTTDDTTTTTDDTTTTTDDTTTTTDTEQTPEEAAAQSLVGDAGNQSEFDCLVTEMDAQPDLVTALSSDSESYDLSSTDASAAASSVSYCLSYNSMVDVYENLLSSTDAFSTSEISCITGELMLWDYATMTDLLALNYGLPATEDELFAQEDEIFGYCYE